MHSFKKEQENKGWKEGEKEGGKEEKERER